jgi:hypothetical protein
MPGRFSDLARSVFTPLSYIKDDQGVTVEQTQVEVGRGNVGISPSERTEKKQAYDEKLCHMDPLQIKIPY